MEDKKTKDFTKIDSITSAIGSLEHEESTPSNVVSQPNDENLNKKNLPTNTESRSSSMDTSSAHDKQDAAELTETSIDDEDFVLRVESSDCENETLELSVAVARKEIKSANLNKSETLFSDIESSDDSIAYESEGKSKVSTKVMSADKESTQSAVEADVSADKKVIETEFDPVESDEEFFEDPPLPEGTEQISQESISDKCLEAEERNSTPLIDEEIGESTELNLDTQEVIAMKTPKSNQKPDETVDLNLETSVDVQKDILEESTDSPNRNKDEITTEIKTSKDLFEDDSEEMNDKATVDSLRLDETKTVSSSSFLLEEEIEKCPPNEPDINKTDMETAENLNSTDEISNDMTMNPPKVSTKIPSQEKNTEKLGESLPNDAAEIISMSSNLVENENISPTVPPQTMETDIAMTEEINSTDDEKLEVEESFVSVSEQVEVVEPMQIDDSILEVSGVSEMETNEDQPTIEKTDKSSYEKEPQNSTENEKAIEDEITSKVDETSLNCKEILAEMETISDTDEPIEKTSKEPNKVQEKPTNTKPDEKVSGKDSVEIRKMEERVKSNEEDNSNKEAPHCDSIEDIRMVDADNTISDDVLVPTPKLSADDEIQEVECTAEEKVEKEHEEATESLEKPDDVKRSTIEVLDESDIISGSLDDPKAIKDVAVCNETSVENDKESPKTSGEQRQEDTKTPSEIQNADLDTTSPVIIEEILESSKKSKEKVLELIEKEESPKEIEESVEKSVESISDSPKEVEKLIVASASSSTEKLESSKKLVETSEESNKQLSDSIENNESSKKIVEIITEPLEIDESPQQIVETAKKLVKPTNDSGEKEEALNETVDLSEDSNKAEDSPQAPVEVEQSETPNAPKTTEEQESPKEIAESKKTADSKEPPKDIEVTKSSDVISSNTETLSEAVEIPDVAMEVLVEKVVEVASQIESTDSKDISNSGVNQDAKKSSSVVDPEIIEIDDDDDDIEEEKKKEEESPKKDEKAASSLTTTEKELGAKKNEDEETKTTENKESNDLSTPMDIDEEIKEQIPSQPPVEVQPSVDQDANKVPQSAVNDSGGDEKLNDKVSLPVLDDDEEPLLMIDTSHIEDNDNESVMDNETATSAPTTDSSSDGSLELFYDKECINYECKRATKNYFRATVFTLNYFKISKKRSKAQFVCEDCYDRALGSYEELCKTLKQKQPLLHGTTFKCQEFVEIIDSSDEEESDAGGDKIKDENTLPKESIEMLEAELEGAIRKVMHNVDIQKQLSWTKQILQQRLTNLQEDSDFVTEQLRALQRKADHMHNSLYQCPKIKLRQLTPLDLNSGRMYSPETDNSTSKLTKQMPPQGEIVRPPICVNEQYYAVKTKAIASWVPCKVIEEVEAYPVAYNQLKTYKIRFTKLAKYPMFKTVYAKHIAYYDPPNVRLPIGSRVIAYFDATSLSRGKEKMLIPSAFYPGIIAEPLKQSNKFRYLVFYDDGYFQYVNHKDVRLVCQASENVWEDVHHQSREFIHNYLTQYAVNRPMVQTQKGQSMLVDYNGKWIYARVIDVDCSLVQMLFEGQSRSEWIYRGSTRLGPVYKESNNLSQKNTLNATRRRTEPFIRYINGDDSSSSQQVQEPDQAQAKAGSSEIRSVAKKSVSRVDTSNNNNSTTSSASQPVPTVRHLNNSTIFVDDDNKPKGKVVYYTARKNLPPRDYVPHICNPACPFNITHNLTFYSPLAKPLLSGWERQVFRQKSKKFIIYRGPCGKRMRNIEELHRYLRVTDNELNVDNFDFSPDTNCLAEYVLEKCLVNKKDISCGKEKMPIPCVNYYDESMPPACEYSAVRIPTEGVPLNLDEEFLCGCDCEDDCSDKTKCACWQLTYAGAKYGMPSVPTEMVGYQYKRLYEHVPTGIYECNPRCKCKSNCVNRVVQQPLQSKLQVFKTSNRGWGLRCINDVPRGSFICVYAGQMLTEQVANEGGLDAGDEYFAELDYIEVAEQIKEGYESDVHEPDEEEDLYNPEREDDDTDFRASLSYKDKEFNTRLRARRGNKNSTDGECESQERQVISFEPNKNMDTSTEPNEKPTIRKLFGKDESCYVMDAKVRGNLGRYFNHSCSPNLFVQNVFVDTHDLRFPWVAFFASTHIRAGTELTWNYNYEVGVVPGKVLYCQCGAPNCRQRLL